MAETRPLDQPLSRHSLVLRIEDRGSRVADRGSRVEGRGSRIEGRGTRVEGRGPRPRLRFEGVTQVIFRGNHKRTRECGTGRCSSLHLPDLGHLDSSHSVFSWGPSHPLLPLAEE